MSQKRRRKFTTVERTLDIKFLGRHGEGMAEHESGRHFVPYTLAGETVRATISGKKAKLDQIITASPDRIEPICPHFTRCGGCAVQHLKQDMYQSWKQGIVQTALQHKEIDADVSELIDAHGDGRRRVTLHIKFTKGRVIAGFMKSGSHDLIDLDTCPILVPELGNVTEIARKIAAPFASSCHKLDLQITATDNGLDCDIRGGGQLDYNANVALAEVADACDVARVSADGDTILERRKPTLRMGAANVTPPPGGFLQATQKGEETLAGLILEHIGGAKNVADLFCGAGPFALRVAQKAAVTGFDYNDAAVNAFNNAVRFTSGLKPAKAIRQDLFREPVHHVDLNKFDAVIVDPPRAGAEQQMYEIIQSNIKVVASVSCDPVTFSRDAGILIDAGFTLEKVIPVDQFRYASHIEIVGLFRRM